MIDTTGLDAVASDSSKDDQEVANFAAKLIYDGLIHLQGNQPTADQMKEINADMSRLMQTLYDSNRFNVYFAIKEYLDRIFGIDDDGCGGCGGSGGGCGDDCCGGSGDGCCGDDKK